MDKESDFELHLSGRGLAAFPENVQFKTSTIYINVRYKPVDRPSALMHGKDLGHIVFEYLIATELINFVHKRVVISGSNNAIPSVPPWIGRLANLVQLDLSNNLLERLVCASMRLKSLLKACLS